MTTVSANLFVSFFMFFCFAWDKTMPGQFLRSVRLLGHLCDLRLIEACLTHGRSVHTYSEDDSRVKCEPIRVKNVCQIHGLARRCFLSSCLCIEVMILRKGLLLLCLSIKINSNEMDGCPKTDLRMPCKSCLHPWGVLLLSCEGSATWLERFIPVGSIVTYPFCIPVGCCFQCIVK